MRRTKTTATRWGHIIDDFFAVMKRGYNIYPKQYTIIYDNKVCSDVRNCMFFDLFCSTFIMWSVFQFCLTFLFSGFFVKVHEIRIRKILLCAKIFCWITQPYTSVETRARLLLNFVNIRKIRGNSEKVNNGIRKVITKA